MLNTAWSAGGWASDWATSAARYLDLFVPAQRQAARNRGGSEPILRRIQSEEKRLAILERELTSRAPGPALDPKGADLGAGFAAVAGLRNGLRTMKETLKTGQWPKPGEHVWWWRNKKQSQEQDYDHIKQ